MTLADAISREADTLVRQNMCYTKEFALSLLFYKYRKRGLYAYADAAYDLMEKEIYNIEEKEEQQEKERRRRRQEWQTTA